MLIKKNTTDLDEHANTISNKDISLDSLTYDLATVIFQWIMFTVVCQLIDLFGISTNFVKQGFKDPVNVSLLGLAIADIGCLATLVWTNICITPAFSAADLPFEPIEFQHLTSGMPHTTFTRISGWITAIITLERCLCIAAPLKVKSIVTTKRVAILISSIFIVLIVSVAPIYVVNKLEHKFSPTKNRTLLGLVFAPDREHVETLSFAINNVFVPFSAFFVITGCTIILVIKLQQTTRWRQQSAANDQADIASRRSQKVATMVVMISTLFIVCFIPFSIIFIAMALEPGLSLFGKYRNLIIILAGIGTVLESINSSINIFIYYKMSSKYKSVFRQIFSLASGGSTKSGIPNSRPSTPFSAT